MTSLNKKLEIESLLLDLLLIFKKFKIRSIRIQNDFLFHSKLINQNVSSSKFLLIILKVFIFAIVVSSDSF